MKYLKEKFSKEQLFIIATVLCLSTPFYICVPILLVETIYLFYTKKSQMLLKILLNPNT